MSSPTCETARSIERPAETATEAFKRGWAKAEAALSTADRSEVTDPSKPLGPKWW